MKNSLEENYNGEVGYSNSVGNILNNEQLLQNLEAKTEQLNALATGLGLTKNYETLRYIAKGKWILHSYAKNSQSLIDKLKDKCKDAHITTCQFCLNGNYGKCQYKIQANIQLGQLIEMIKNILDLSELNYIIEKLKTLN